ncbi:TraQ conjugal transfer family protein [Phocaeicola vulgatus]|uniref:DUF3872 domain-containing protein n=1 Tax=Phocaeicola vulgatus TaxID=821 RepID=A0A415DEU9_PHOVU|nr:DUF3872 domain-containing protein [Phocaeicola vulgatus]
MQKYAINCYETAITYQKHYFQSNYKGKLEYKNGKSFITNNLYPFKKIRFYYISVSTYQQKLDLLLILSKYIRLSFGL